MVYIVIATTPDRRNNLNTLLESIRQHTQDVPHCVVIYENQDGGWVRALRNAIEGIDGYVQLLGDDVVVQAGWLKTIQDHFFAQFPYGDGVVQPLDEIHGGKLAVHPFLHTKTLHRYGCWKYIHSFFDTELTERAKADGKYLYVPEAKVEHRHWINGKAEKDGTYTLTDESFQKDLEIFKRRLACGFG